MRRPPPPAAGPAAHTPLPLTLAPATHAELDVDFDRQVIEGYAQVMAAALAQPPSSAAARRDSWLPAGPPVQVDAEALCASPSQLVFDTRDLTIHSVTVQAPGSSQAQAGTFRIGEEQKVTARLPAY